MIDFFQHTLSEITFFQWAALVVFGLLFMSRLFYRLFFSLRILIHKKRKPAAGEKVPLSLLLTIRNEEDNLKKNLPEILKLKNADFEVVAVDDFSQDNSLPVLGVMKQDDVRIRFSSLNQETRNSVKMAQNIALKAAKNEWVMAVPVSVSGFGPGWLSCIAELAGSAHSIVVNYSNVAAAKGFINQLYRVENFMQQYKSAGFCKAGLPFVYSEANVAFRKEMYFKSGGYGQKVKEPYANLELIFNASLRKRNTVIHLQAETAVWQSMKVSKDDYFELLKKSIRIENYLSFPKKLVLFLDEFTKLFFVPALILVIALIPELWVIYSILTVLLLVLQLLIIKIILNRLNERKLFLSSLVYDLLMPFFRVYYRWYFKQRIRNHKWRSRN
jgi:glycosyltransferase involved in cell wall biosynthesis